MTTLYIAELGELCIDNDGTSVPVGKTPRSVSQVVSFTTAASSAAFSPGTKFLRIVSTGNCHIDFSGADATTSNGWYLPATMVEYVGVSAGGTLSVIDAA